MLLFSSFEGSTSSAGFFMMVLQINKGGGILFSSREINYDKCWIYIGPAYWDDGYPIIHRHNKNWIASRFIWYIITGRDYYKREVHHKCEVRSCINPLHLEEISSKRHKKYHSKKRKTNHG